MAAVGPCIPLSSGRTEFPINCYICCTRWPKENTPCSHIGATDVNPRCIGARSLWLWNTSSRQMRLGDSLLRFAPGAKVSARKTSAGLGAPMVVGLRASSGNIPTKPEPLARTARISASAGAGSRRREPVPPGAEVRRSVDAGSFGNAQSLILRSFLLITA